MYHVLNDLSRSNYEPHPNAMMGMVAMMTMSSKDHRMVTMMVSHRYIVTNSLGPIVCRNNSPFPTMWSPQLQYLLGWNILLNVVALPNGLCVSLGWSAKEKSEAKNS